MKKLFVFLLLPVCGLTSLAQEIKIAPVIGISGSHAGLSQTYQNDYASALYQSAGIRGTTTYMPVVRAQTGALLEYSPNDRLSFQTGLLVNLRGSKMVTKFTNTQGLYSTGKLSVKINSTYLELPLLVGLGLGKSGVKMRIGPSIGVAVNARLLGLLSGGGETDSYSEKLNIGNDAKVDDVKPFDVSANLNIAKQWLIGQQALEVSLNLQPSLSNWLPAINSDHHGRHITVGLRAAYFFSIRP